MTEDGTMATTRRAAAAIAEGAKETGRHALDATRETLGDAASAAGTALREEARARADAGKQAIAAGGAGLARGLREAAREQRDNSLQARIIDTLADSISELSDDLSGRSVSSILGQIEDFARRNPGAFVAGAAVVGFAAARFARSGTPVEAPREKPEAGP